MKLAFNIFLFALLCLPSKGGAQDNITGGQLFYTLIASTDTTNTYHIKYVWHRYYDCVPMVQEPPLGITIRDTLGTSFHYVATVDTFFDLSPPNYPCVYTNEGICMRQIEHSVTVELPIISDSYFVLHQNCCRISNLTNVIDSIGGGLNPNILFHAYTEITPEAQLQGNNAPVISETVPFYTCVNEPFDFSFSGNDQEGDQLVYALCAPSSSNATIWYTPIPLPPYEPPSYIFPPYNAINPLGDDVLSLDANTGELYAFPTEAGNFVVGMCINEYRNGVLMSTTNKDFVLFVLDCEPQVEAIVQADSVGANNTFFIEVCNDDQFQLNNLSVQPEFITDFYWEINGQVYSTWDPLIIFPASGTFTGQLVLNPGQSCIDTAFLVFEVLTDLEVNFVAEYDTCVAGPVNLISSVDYSGQSPLDYFWKLDDGHFNNNASFTHSYESPGTYNICLTVSDVHGCRDSVIQTILWQPAPAIILVAPDEAAGCAPLAVHIMNQSWPVDSSYQVIWDFGDSFSQTAIDAFHEFEQAGIYDVAVQVTSPLGCQADSTFEALINVSAAPISSFDYSPAPITYLDSMVQFYDRSSNAVFWEWFFDIDGVAVREENPTYHFPDTGTYLVRQIVYDEYWCSDTSHQTIHVKAPLHIHFPNAFTPNNDGVNDFFGAKGYFETIENWQLTIWNRYGELIFQSTDPNVYWNGSKHNVGRQLPQGVYTYILKAKSSDRKSINLNGQVMLLK